MSESKTFVFPDNNYGGGMLGCLAPMLQQRGLDPNMVFAMMNRNGGGWGNGEGAWFIWILFIFLLWGRNGWGNNNDGGNNNGCGCGNAAGLYGLINNDNGRELLMQAIQGNGNRLGELATTLHCDINSIQQSFNALQTQLCNIGNQIGQGQLHIVNAIQAGNCQIASQLASCCCDIKNLVTTQGYDNQLRTVQQTNDITQNATSNTNLLAAKIDAQTQLLSERFCDLEKREMQREIQALRDERNGYQLSALTQQQTQNLINTLRPCPIPAFQTCNPWGCNGGFYGNGYPYGGYPYGYEGGNGCGSCN